MNTDTSKPLGDDQINETAGVLYWAYCVQIGEKALNGDPLPGWSEFSTDPTKAKQAKAWRTVAQIALEACRITARRAIDSFVEEATKLSYPNRTESAPSFPTPDGGRDKERPILR